MSKRMKSMIKSVFATAAFLATASSASAQGMVGQNQPPDQWVMNCNTSKGRDCTVSAMIDGGPDNLLGTFLIVSYSVAYTTLSVVVDGMGQRASMQVDWHPFISTDICTGGECSYEQGKSNELLQEMLRGESILVQASTQSDSMVGPLKMTLNGFKAQYERALQAQRR
jgi:invasion protein IalB